MSTIKGVTATAFSTATNMDPSKARLILSALEMVKRASKDEARSHFKQNDEGFVVRSVGKPVSVYSIDSEALSALLDPQTIERMADVARSEAEAHQALATRYAQFQAEKERAEAETRIAAQRQKLEEKLASLKTA